MMRSLLRSFVPALSLILAATSVAAQDASDPYDAPGRAGPPVHVTDIGLYTLRANAIPSDFVPPGIAERQGIDRAPDRGVLNLVVLERRNGQQVTVSATVTASKHNLLGQNEEIVMLEVNENGRVSYLGTFGFDPLRNLRFTITAQPVDSVEPLRIDFEDRFVQSNR